PERERAGPRGIRRRSQPGLRAVRGEREGVAMRSVPKLLVLIAFVLPGSTVRAQDTTMYVPAFWVLTEHVTFPSPFEEGWRYWSSVLSAFNPTGQEGVVRRLRGYTSDGPVDFDPS